MYCPPLEGVVLSIVFGFKNMSKKMIFKKVGKGSLKLTSYWWLSINLQFQICTSSREPDRVPFVVIHILTNE